MEREHILRVVQRAGTLRRAAAQLHISLATLTRRLRAYRRPPFDKT
jgi:DNA-binding transcriptional LysR family regulator